MLNPVVRESVISVRKRGGMEITDSRAAVFYRFVTKEGLVPFFCRPCRRFVRTVLRSGKRQASFVVILFSVFGGFSVSIRGGKTVYGLFLFPFPTTCGMVGVGLAFIVRRTENRFQPNEFRSAEIDLHICRIYAEKRGISCMFMRNFTLNYGL